MTNKPVKLAIVGEAGSGKDFIAEMLCDYFGFRRFAFADEVRWVSERYFSEAYGDPSHKNRQILIDVGMKMREIDPYVWVDWLMDEMADYDGNIVVTDTRMPNEYWTLRQAGFKFIRITASPETCMDRIRKRGDVPNETFTKHATESYYDSFECHYEFPNDHNEKILAYAELANLLADEFRIGLPFPYSPKIV